MNIDAKGDSSFLAHLKNKNIKEELKKKSALSRKISSRDPSTNKISKSRPKGATSSNPTHRFYSKLLEKGLLENNPSAILNTNSRQRKLPTSKKNTRSRSTKKTPSRLNSDPMLVSGNDRNLKSRARNQSNISQFGSRIGTRKNSDIRRLIHNRSRSFDHQLCVIGPIIIRLQMRGNAIDLRNLNFTRIATQPQNLAKVKIIQM